MDPVQAREAEAAGLVKILEEPIVPEFLANKMKDEEEE